jgi:hypothetical protein
VNVRVMPTDWLVRAELEPNLASDFSTY